MKQKKCILLIDDKDQSGIIDTIKLQLRNEFDLDFIMIRTSAAELKKKDTEDLDPNKLKTEIQTKIQNKNINIALTDFDLESESINGLGVIKIVHEIRSKIDFFIYSGNWNKVIKTVIGKDYKNASIEELVRGINELIHDRIIDCINRAEYKEDLIKYLKKDIKDSIEQRLISLLRANGNLIFNSCFPEFKGMKFSQIADTIEKHSDARSDEWIEAVLTQTIAYLVEVNHE